MQAAGEDGPVIGFHRVTPACASATTLPELITDANSYQLHSTCTH